MKSPKKPKAAQRLNDLRQIPSSKAVINTAGSRSKWTPIKKAYPLPTYVKQILGLLDDAGFVAYVVGGCVRDYLLKLPVKDFDIATSAMPEELEDLFPGALTIGKAFGVIKVPVAVESRGMSEFLEIATFREDLEYVDHRHPSRVRFAGPDEDAQRRDFTINSLFYDHKSHRIFDVVGGLEDLENGIIRAIGKPEERFKEDALRLLRAIRFACRFDFEIEKHTWDAIILHAKLIKKVSSERVRDEITKMFQGPNPDRARELLQKSGLLKILLPEAEKTSVHLFKALARDPLPRSSGLVWAALLSEVGGEDPTRAIQSMGDKMKLSRDEIKLAQKLVLDLPKFNEAPQMREATLQRWVREPYFDELLQLYRAQAMSQKGDLLAYKMMEFLRQKTLALAGRENLKLLTGDDLIQLGFQPGPQFSKILEDVETLTLENKLKTKDEALEYVVNKFVD